MKRRIHFILTVFLLNAIVLSGCGRQRKEMTDDMAADEVYAAKIEESTETITEGNTEGSTETESTADAGGGNILIAYFSVMETDGVDTVSGASRVAVKGEVLGNNQYIAQIIQQETGGDLFAIETVQEYPTTHDPLLEFAYEEKVDNARPELATQIENPDSYDVIFLGFPNWLAYHNLIQCTQA